MNEPEAATYVCSLAGSLFGKHGSRCYAASASASDRDRPVCDGWWLKYSGWDVVVNQKSTCFSIEPVSK